VLFSQPPILLIPDMLFILNQLLIGSCRAHSGVVIRETIMGCLRKSPWIGFVLLLAASIPGFAQDADDLRRGVARLSVVNGDVSVRRGDSGEWVAAAANAPVMTDDHIATGPNSRAEVQFDASAVLRIGGNAEMGLSQLEYGRYQMEVTHGVVTFTILRPSGTNIEVDTPSVSV